MASSFRLSNSLNPCNCLIRDAWLRTAVKEVNSIAQFRLPSVRVHRLVVRCEQSSVAANLVVEDEGGQGIKLSEDGNGVEIDIGGNGGGNGKSGGGGGGGDGGGEGDDFEEKEFGPILKFDEVMREAEVRGARLPCDMVEAAKSLGIRKVLLLRYLDLQVRL